MLAKVQRNGAIGLPIYGFLLMVNRNIWPNMALFESLQNMSDPEFDLSKSLKVKSNGAVGLPR